MIRIWPRLPVVMIIRAKKGLKARVWLITILGGCLVWLGLSYSQGHSSEQVLAPLTLENTEIVFQTEPVQVERDQVEGYFVDYRLQREQSREETKDMLEVLLASEIEETRQKAEAEWLALNNKITKESEIENILKIKGFKDAIVQIGVDNVSLIIYASSLTPEQVSLIQDVTIRSYPVRLDKIIISVRK